ncbi:MAG: hypothetical protein KGY66_06010 [Candidatus Thermoplasmatota archaeon]|nr:hypothetical protein [Candidatus Thermoplasmatota archaeon]MBS3790454.1 hypothetical protein [Candidatus Thermoplasmatota archaeon]
MVFTLAYLRKKPLVVDVAMVLIILSYLFINEDISPIVVNFLFIIGFLFLFIGMWFFARYLMLTSDIEEDSRKGSKNKQVMAFSSSARSSTVYGIFTNILLAAFISMIASLIGFYSSLGRITSGRIETILMILFTSALFLVVYKMIDLLRSQEE